MVLESGFGQAIEDLVARGEHSAATDPESAAGMGWPVWAEVATGPEGPARARSGWYGTRAAAERASGPWARDNGARGVTVAFAAFDMADTLLDDISGLYRDSLRGSRATIGEAVRG